MRDFRYTIPLFTYSHNNCLSQYALYSRLWQQSVCNTKSMSEDRLLSSLMGPLYRISNKLMYKQSLGTTNPRSFANVAMNTRIILSWAHEQTVTQVYTLFSSKSDYELKITSKQFPPISVGVLWRSKNYHEVWNVHSALMYYFYYWRIVLSEYILMGVPYLWHTHPGQKLHRKYVKSFLSCMDNAIVIKHWKLLQANHILIKIHAEWNILYISKYVCIW